MDPKLNQVLLDVLEYMREVSVAIRMNDVDYLSYMQHMSVDLRVDIKNYVE